MAWHGHGTRLHCITVRYIASHYTTAHYVYIGRNKGRQRNGRDNAICIRTHGWMEGLGLGWMKRYVIDTLLIDSILLFFLLALFAQVNSVWVFNRFVRTICKQSTPYYYLGTECST